MKRALRIATPAAISVATLVALSLVITWGWQHPEQFGSVSAYRAAMNVAVFARLGPIYFSAIIVWPAMRFRGATIPWATIGVLSSALAYGVMGALQQLTFFVPAQAAYYVFNPMVVAAVGAQIGFAALAEVFVRWRRADTKPLHSWRFWLIVALVAILGFTLLYVGVIWDGGRHWFYVWMRGFTFLFGNGQ